MATEVQEQVCRVKHTPRGGEPELTAAQAKMQASAEGLALVRADNATGFKRVYVDGGRFQVQVSEGGKSIYLGNFRTPEAAALAYARRIGPEAAAVAAAAEAAEAAEPELTAGQAEAQAREEGLALVRADNATGFKRLYGFYQKTCHTFLGFGWAEPGHFGVKKGDDPKWKAYYNCKYGIAQVDVKDYEASGKGAFSKTISRAAGRDKARRMDQIKLPKLHEPPLGTKRTHDQIGDQDPPEREQKRSCDGTSGSSPSEPMASEPSVVTQTNSTAEPPPFPDILALIHKYLPGNGKLVPAEAIDKACEAFGVPKEGGLVKQANAVWRKLFCSSQ